MHEIVFWFRRQHCGLRKYDKLTSAYEQYAKKLNKYQQAKYRFSRRVGPTPLDGWHVSCDKSSHFTLRECVENTPLLSLRDSFLPDVRFCNHDILSFIDERIRHLNTEYKNLELRIVQLHDSQVAKGFKLVTHIDHWDFSWREIEQKLVRKGVIDHDYNSDDGYIPDSTDTEFNQELLDYCVEQNFVDITSPNVQFHPFLVRFE